MTDTVPDFMPVLSVGRHTNPKDGACFMEMASYLAGEPWTDSPTCTHPVIASLARTVNDRIDHEGRQRLAPLIPSVIGTPQPSRGRRRRVRKARRLLNEHLLRWIAQRANVALDPSELDGWGSAPYGMFIWRAVGIVEDKVGLLTGLIAEYDRITGRTQHPQPTFGQYRALADHLQGSGRRG